MTARRVLLMLLLVATSAVPALAQMPDVRQMSGVPMPMSDTPPGTVVVRLVRIELGNDIASHPVELHFGSDIRRATTDDTGRATFAGLPAGVTLHAVAQIDGERLESQNFVLPADVGIRVMLVAGLGAGAPSAAAPPLGQAAAAPAAPGEVLFGGQSRIHIEFDDDQLEVFYLLELINPASTPVTPAAELVFELPANAQAPSPLEGSSTLMTLRGRTATISGPIPPGMTPIQLAYGLASAGGTRTLSQTFPIAWSPVQVVVTQIGNVQLRSSQLAGVSNMPGDQHAFVFGQGPALAAATPFSVELSGLPVRSRVGRYVTLVLAALVIAVGLWAARTTGGRSAGSLRRAQLETRRERLMADLARLERQPESARDTTKQAARRADLVAQLERIYGELDQRSAPGTGADA